MTRRISMILLLLVCAVQAGVPVAMIVRREVTLRQGEPFRFRCAPVDPVDVFRGRYVELAFDEESYEGPVDEALVRGQTVFARLDVDDEGFARVVGLGPEPPEKGSFLRCRVRWTPWSGVVLEFPFGRYYMKETNAPRAEELYREHGPSTAWVEARILDGYAVLEELFIDGVPVGELPALEGNEEDS